MSNGSPTAYLLWAVLSTIFFIFLIAHLWSYDRFKCLRWGSGRQPGAFRRVMVYSYLATVPLLVLFSVVMTNIKFQEGYYVFNSPTIYINPRPFQLWSPEHRRWLFPLNLILSCAWSFEMVTHLEELSFWLFLLHQGPESRVWFESWEYKAWGLGSLLALLGLPLTAVITRHDINRTQAWVFVVGSIASTSTTIFFLYILYRFPEFIQLVKQGGATPDVVVRLATFYNLNRIRVVFRFLFTIPLLTIGIDAFCSPFRVVMNSFLLDFLLMISGIGCFVSSAITLFVFFPRNMTQEAGYTTKMPSTSKVPTLTSASYYHDPQHPHDMDMQLGVYPASGSKQSFPSSDHFESDEPTSDGRSEVFVRPSREMAINEWMTRESGELSSEGDAIQSSTGWGSDVDGLSSQDAPSPRSGTRPLETERRDGEPQNQNSDRESTGRIAVSQAISNRTTATHRPTSMEAAIILHGSRCDSPIFVQSPLSPRRRRHSETPFVAKNLTVVVPPFQKTRASWENEWKTRGHGEDEKQSQGPFDSSSPVIHPYLMTFTSPIDLLDTFTSDSHINYVV